MVMPRPNGSIRRCLAVLTLAAGLAPAQQALPPETEQEESAAARVRWSFRDDRAAAPPMLEQSVIPPLNGSGAMISRPKEENPPDAITLPSSTTLVGPGAGISLASIGSEASGRGLPGGDFVDYWTSSTFADDAELLTPFSQGHEVLSWDLGERLTLAGVGSRRVWDDRNRAFIVSAEAGFNFSSRAGLQVGYELIETSVETGLGSPASGDSVFARFQIRF